MIDRVHEVAADFRKATNRAMADTTKRTIAENVAIESQLGKMADKSTEVLQENSSLQHQVSARRRHVTQFEMAQNDLAKDYISGCKVVTIRAHLLFVIFGLVPGILSGVACCERLTFYCFPLLEYERN
jgi:hypothetical protein